MGDWRARACGESQSLLSAWSYPRQGATMASLSAVLPAASEESGNGAGSKCTCLSTPAFLQGHFAKYMSLKCPLLKGFMVKLFGKHSMYVSRLSVNRRVPTK